ncbi:fimbrial protein [Salmonella enterica subsp. enterica serovar Javiana]|nr:fimbrial protein [Salmonella enterica subsp. enterica serovar Javiana]
MKKTLTALALAATTVSGSAMAWTEGDFNGSIDMGGSISPEKSGWQWKLGDSQLDGFNLNASDATASGNNLVWNGIGTAFPVLMGKTLKPYGNITVGMIPVITYGGEGFSIKSSETSAPEVTLTAKGKTDGSKVGTLKFNLNMFALSTPEWKDANGSTYTYQQIVDPSKSYGNGFLQNAGYYKTMTSTQVKDAIIRILGGDMITINGAVIESNYTDAAQFNSAITAEQQGAYASEFVDKSGTLTFPSNNVPTDWKSSLTVTVSYQ